MLKYNEHWLQSKVIEVKIQWIILVLIDCNNNPTAHLHVYKDENQIWHKPSNINDFKHEHVLVTIPALGQLYIVVFALAPFVTDKNKIHIKLLIGIIITFSDKLAL